MIENKTVLIIGAGAHVPFGFPTGKQLKQDILKETAALFPHFKKEVEDLQKDFRHSLEDSIDAFLEKRHEQHLAIGKLLISSVLLKYEYKVKETIFDADPSKNWFAYVLNSKLRHRTLEEFVNAPISFITFNYDRSLEHLLHTALQARFDLESRELNDAMQQLRIHHVHGTLGRLHWEKDSRNEDRVPFGAQPTNENIPVAARAIRLVHEEGQDLEKANAWLMSAQRIFFLGFSYHPDNLKKLTLPYGMIGKNLVRIGGTAMGCTEAEREDIRRHVFKSPDAPNNRAGHPDHDCLAYLRNQDLFV